MFNIPNIFVLMYAIVILFWSKNEKCICANKHKEFLLESGVLLPPTQMLTSIDRSNNINLHIQYGY